MHPDPIFTVFGKGVYLYGICMALGLIACFAFLIITMRIKKFNEASSDTIIFIGIFGTGFGILAAAIFQGVYNVIADPSEGFSLNSMTFIGGLIGGVSSFLLVWNGYVYLLAPRTKVKFLQNNMNAGLSDALPFIPIGIAIAHAFGRFGCFWGGCCYGVEATDGVWGLPCKAGSSTLVVPTQLYEMFFLIALAAVMAILYFKYDFHYNFGVYAVSYGIWRFILEFFRADDRGALILGLQPSQFWSIIMVILGIGYFFLQYYVLSKFMKHPELQTKENKGAEPTEPAAPTEA